MNIGKCFKEDVEAARCTNTLLTFESVAPVKINKYSYEARVPAESTNVFCFQDPRGGIQKQFIQERILSQIHGVYNFVFKRFTKTPTGATVNYMCIRDHYIYNLRCRKRPILNSKKVSAQSLLCKGCLYVYFNHEHKTVRIEHRHMHHIEKNSTNGLSLAQRQKIVEFVENSSSTDHLYTNAVFEEIMKMGSTIKKDTVFRAIRRAVERKHRKENPILKFLLENVEENSHLFATHCFISSEYLGFAFLSRRLGQEKNIKNLFITSNERFYNKSIKIITAYDARNGDECVPIAYSVMFQRIRKGRRVEHESSTAVSSVRKLDLRLYKTFVDQIISILESSNVEALSRGYSHRIFRMSSRPDLHESTNDSSPQGSPPTINSDDHTINDNRDSVKKTRCHMDHSRRTDDQLLHNKELETLQWFLQLLKAQGVVLLCISCEAKKDQIQAVKSIFGDDVPLRIHLERVKLDVVEQISRNERLNEGAFDDYFRTAPSPDHLPGFLCWSNTEGNIVCDCEKLKPCPRTHRGVLERYYTRLSKEDINIIQNMIDRHSKYTSQSSTGGSRPESQNSFPGAENMCAQEVLQWCISKSAYSRWIYLWKTWYSDDKRKLWMEKRDGENVPLEMNLSGLNRRIQRNEFSSDGLTECQLDISSLIRDMFAMLASSLIASSLDVDVS